MTVPLTFMNWNTTMLARVAVMRIAPFKAL